MKCTAFGSFIVSSTLDKPDPTTRKFIRSYVMRGKNRRRPRGRGAAGNDLSVVPQQRPPLSKALGGQVWVTLPPRAFYNQISLLGFGDDLAPYMKHLIYQGTESQPRATSHFGNSC
ncbi:hypothetical protein IMZ48_47950 [Candidatus Bathyarchaeota archaeon]|nr:hypothetical protein [Candidatus Bathyarchaeota archaeon]